METSYASAECSLEESLSDKLQLESFFDLKMIKIIEKYTLL